MQDFLRRFSYKVQSFMYGRNGRDTLNTFLLISSLVLCVLSSFKPFALLYPVSAVIFIYMLYRFFSKNLEKRRRENAKFFDFKLKAKKELNLYKKMWQEKNTHRYFKCPNCKKSLRVPKGRGKIEIICPKCGIKFVRKS